jgi:hypothetical protein
VAHLPRGRRLAHSSLLGRALGEDSAPERRRVGSGYVKSRTRWEPGFSDADGSGPWTICPQARSQKPSLLAWTGWIHPILRLK